MKRLHDLTAQATDAEIAAAEEACINSHWAVHRERANAASALHHLHARHVRELEQIELEANEAIESLEIELVVSQRRAAKFASELIVAYKGRDPSELSRLLCKAENCVRFNAVDREVLEHLLKHIVHPGAEYSPFMADLSNHFANVLGMQEFLTMGSIFRLPKEVCFVCGPRCRKRITTLILRMTDADLGQRPATYFATINTCRMDV